MYNVRETHVGALMGNRGLEIKVGLFLMVSVAILVGFLFILGTFDFGDGHVIQLQFPNTGGLRNGAKVKISGVLAGKIQDIEFLGGKETNDKGEPIYVRIEIEVDDEMAPVLTVGSTFSVSTEGILGEKYVEISPGPPGAARLESGAVVDGEPPVELQVLAGRAAGMMDKVQEFMDGDRTELKSLGETMRQIVDRTNSVLTRVDEELPALVAEGKATMEQAQKSLQKLDLLVDDGRHLLARKDGVTDGVEKFNRIAAGLEDDLPRAIAEVETLLEESRLLVAETRTTMERLETDLALTTDDARGLMRRTGRAVEGLDIADTLEDFKEPVRALVANLADTGSRIATLSSSAEGLLTKADTVLSDLAVVSSNMRQGRGTVGALLRDRELYDDIRELVLELKRHPWKAIWKAD
jgi:phospholipid/cholesterol/gamma-HCH transport system substrate-binding protein